MRGSLGEQRDNRQYYQERCSSLLLDRDVRGPNDVFPPEWGELSFCRVPARGWLREDRCAVTDKHRRKRREVVRYPAQDEMVRKQTPEMKAVGNIWLWVKGLEGEPAHDHGDQERSSDAPRRAKEASQVATCGWHRILKSSNATCENRLPTRSRPHAPTSCRSPWSPPKTRGGKGRQGRGGATSHSGARRRPGEGLPREAHAP